ncbi:MAG: helix-turn-helix transcriptional regulator [Clostridium sp.]|nr:helix-turn-helix transcriptional regulator [Clostridium sp.]
MIKSKIKEIRNNENMKQKDLAEKIFVNANTISQYESGARTINSETLENITTVLGYNISFIKKEDKPYIIEEVSHVELIDKMNSTILEQTGINMNFQFELCSDGNTDLYARHIFSREDINKLIKLGWIDEDILEYYDFNYNTNPFELDEELNLPNQLFEFILQKTYKEGTLISGIYDLEEYIKLNISIPL